MKLRWRRKFKPKLIWQIPYRFRLVLDRRLRYLTGERDPDVYPIPGATWGYIGPFTWYTVGHDE